MAMDGDRPLWANRAEFLLASVGYAVGLGNVWRFPYVCLKNGGGAFFIPYITMMCLCALPLVFMEFGLGQYTRLGPVQAFLKICPLMKGVGISTLILSFVVSTYNNTVMAWALYYLFNSFSTTLPWQLCNATWNIPENCSTNTENTTHLQSAAQQFFDRRLLEITDGIEKVGQIRWDLFGILILVWIMIYFCIFKGVKSTGKVVYVTALCPYVILLILFVNNVRLPGAGDGIMFYLTPRWSKLGIVQVWIDAITQTFYSIGVGFGVMISMASHNRFHNNLLRDALFVSIANSATSIFAGFVIFSGIGYMAHSHGLEVDKLAVGGPGLVFVVYPEIFSTLPISQLWAFLFFLMLLTLGLDSQFGHMELLVNSIMESCGSKILCVPKKRELVSLLLCLVILLLGIPCITQGGVYIFQLFDYSVGMSALLTSLSEVVALCWIFGVKKISIMVKQTTGKTPSIYFKACWLVISPLLIVVIFITSIVQHNPMRYGKIYRYPSWAGSAIWLLTMLTIVWIPLGAIHELLRQKGTFWMKWKASVTPKITVEEAPHMFVERDKEIQGHGSMLLSLSEINPLHEVR